MSSIRFLPFRLILLMLACQTFSLHAAQGDHQKLLEKLKTIRIPEVKLQKVPLPEALNFLVAASREYDPHAEENPRVAGINVVLLTRESPPPVVTLNVRNLSVGAILGFLTELTGYVYEVRENAVVVRKPKPKAPKRKQSTGPLLETEIYELGEGLKRRLLAQP